MTILLANKHFKNEQWMTSDEAQHYLKVSRTTLYRWCKTRQLPFTKLGGVLYFPKVFIEQLMARRLQNSSFFEE